MDVVMTVEGKTPLMMHSQRGMNPRDPLAQELARIVTKRKKTIEDREAISDLELILSLYHDEKLGPFIRAIHLKRCIEDGGKHLKLGTHVRQALHADPDRMEFPLIYSGPRDLDGLQKDHNFRDVRTVGVSGRAVERTRAIFRQWKFVAHFNLDTERLDLADLQNCADRAGKYIGLLEYRPEYGLFSIGIEEARQ